MSEKIRLHAEEEFAEELAALKKADSYPKPPNWELSPWAVLQYLMGGELENGFEISPKYIGNARLIEIAIATLATDRALLLVGIPGTGKSWVSEHLAAAISGNSTLLVQGTAGISEDALRYSWNYAQLLAHGPSRDAMVPSPIMRAMRSGKIARVEELTRIPAEVQDSLITLLSEKILPVQLPWKKKHASSRRASANSARASKSPQSNLLWQKYGASSPSFASFAKVKHKTAKHALSRPVVPLAPQKRFLWLHMDFL